MISCKVLLLAYFGLGNINFRKKVTKLDHNITLYLYLKRVLLVMVILETYISRSLIKLSFMSVRYNRSRIINMMILIMVSNITNRFGICGC